MNRTGKAKMLSQLLAGETTLLRQFKRHAHTKKNLMREEVHTLSIVQLTGMYKAKIPLPVEQMNSIQILAMRKVLATDLVKYPDLDPDLKACLDEVLKAEPNE